MRHRHPVAGSTQDLAHQLAAAGAPAGTAVVAGRQTLGRGTRGRTWYSDEGGLWLSVVLRPDAAAAGDPLSLRIGLATARVLETAAGRPIGLKWPNDLMAGDRKVGGILCEARWAGERLDWIVVGIGINVANPVPPDVVPPAIRLADWGFAGGPADLESPVVDAVMAAAAGRGSLSPGELAEFGRRDWLRGRPVAGPVTGLADGVSPAGRLRILTEDGRVVESADAAGLVPLAPDAPTR